MHKVIQDLLTLKNQNAKEWGWARNNQFPWKKELGGKTRSRRFHPTFNTIMYRLRYDTIRGLSILTTVMIFSSSFTTCHSYINWNLLNPTWKLVLH